MTVNSDALALPSPHPAHDLRRPDGPQVRSEKLPPSASGSIQEGLLPTGCRKRGLARVTLFASLKEKNPEPPALSFESPSNSITSYQTADSEDGGYSVEEDPIESWYADVRYLPALSESTFDILERVLSPCVTSSVKRELYRTNGERTMGLNDRNVRISPCLPIDPFLVVFGTPGSLRESGSGVHVLDLHDEVGKYHVDEWKLDLEKAREDGTEATFQRTVMMSMLGRYRLMYNAKDGNQPVLDFAVESTWNCPFMPTRALKRDKPGRQRMLLRPKPDLSVAFRLSSIIEDGLMLTIPEATRRIMTYEAQDGTRTQRAFHFLMIEANNSDGALSDKDGQLQSLNSASQSLHCLYEFLNEADRKRVDCNKPCCTPDAATITTDDRESPPAGEDMLVGLFFKEVRVFTAALTGTTITIRMHRACLASPPPFPPHDGRPPFQPPILPDYPLQFEHNELIRLSNNDFARETLVDTFEKIMVDYGVGRLRPLLQEAAKAIADQFYRWEKEKGMQYVLGMRHYSHGQTALLPGAQTSRAASQAARLSSVPATSNPQRQGPARRADSSASEDPPAAQFSSTAQIVGGQLEPPKKKTKMH
ncbi:hypothetical protein EKO27_g911 [Xylaria grammica]|uniref:Uncharacterized protein n=1 Tax=Xylaria grammica TaxID=363999 RepID=A0A439DIG4_9PEZI|nr:hypothetical protein EKO27_g911 [Xylaria grammica]